MTDPFSKAIRELIPWNVYRRRKLQQLNHTLIGLGDFSQQAAVRRLAELKDEEELNGFVYLGESRWLESRLHLKKEDYDAWAFRMLRQFVFPEMTYSVTFDVGDCWRGYTENLDILWIPEIAARLSIELKYLDVLLPGGQNGPGADTLRLAFSILHDLAYYVDLASQNYTRAAWIDQIELNPCGTGWSMYLMNEYGSIGSVEFCDEQVVRDG